ncbi:MAG: hypothetical protein LQ344_002172 [Seirophora lacunosa]|nr:MAG: hypothetical protein LQ344_002172 [Seirophora lacunosa]
MTETTPLQHLSALADALSSAIECVPSAEAFAPPREGLSLLDIKNDLLLSYLQNCVFLIIFKLRNQDSSHKLDGEGQEPSYDEIVKTLVSLRLYLEKGIRPLESRLKYQVDKLLLAAAESSTQPTSQPNNRQAEAHKRPASTSSASASHSDDDLEAPDPTTIPDLSHRPNLSAFARPRPSSPQTAAKRDSSVYRPPRITPTALHTTDRPAQASAHKRKNAMLDTFIREELSSAPVAEPSIGAGNGLWGREAQRERERKEYEEMRLVRLPSEGGKKKKGKREMERMGSGFDEVLGGAGEGLGEAVKGAGGKRRKTAVGGSGEAKRIGEAWEKRKRMGVRGMGGKRR